MSNPHHLVVIAGPTGVGKTRLAIDLALRYNTEILSADSRQFYRELKIGTAKPSAEELKLVKHHFINSLSIHDDYSAGQFELDANRLLSSLFRKFNVVITAGGSGLYIKALCEGMDQLPEIPTEVRDQLNNDFQEKGITFLQEKLKTLDPAYYELVDRNNPQRMIRALEICLFTGESYSIFLNQQKKKRPYTIHKIGLNKERDQLYQQINLRVDRMLEKGLMEEAKELYELRHLNALQTVGYTEIFDYLSGKYDREEAVRLLKRNSRRYAKRQLTWFRRDQEIQWFNGGDELQIKNWLKQKIRI